jgi:GTP-binding protein EngB required for normal cell division
LCWRLRDLHERIAQDQFRLAVVGQFKRGKTSLLNALLEETDLLPVGALPFTSVLTIVQYGIQKAAEVVFQSGSRLSISLSELKNYVTEAGNPNNCKMVEQVEVFCPGEILRGGISLVNSPGFGSLSDQNTKTAYGYLPRIDAAIFVTSPDPPLTAAEMEFLRKLTLSTRKVFIVINKIDLLDRASHSDVVEFTTEAIAQIVGDPWPAVYALSALRAIAPGQNDGADLLGLQRLKLDICDFVSAERNETFLVSVRRCLMASISELLAELGAHTASAAATIEDLDRKRIQFESEIKNLYDHLARSERTLVEMVSRLADLAEHETVRFAESKRMAFDLPLLAFVRQNEEMPKSLLASALNDFVALQVENLLAGWAQDLETSLVRTAFDTIARFVQSANDIVATIRERALEYFGVQISTNAIVECLPAIAFRPRHRMDLAVPSRSRAMRLIPRPLLRAWLLRQAQERVRRMLQQAGQGFGSELNARTRMEIQSLADRGPHTIAGKY